MRVTAKTSLFIAVILVVLTGALALASTSVITSVIANLNAKLLAAELANVRKNLAERHETLVHARVDGIESYVELAQKRALEHFRSYRYGDSGTLHLMGPDGPALLNPLAMQLDDPCVRRLERAELDGPGELRYRVDGQDRMGVYVHFPKWNWTLALTMAEEEVFAGRAVYLRNIALISLGIFLCVLALTFYFSIRTVRRLRGILRRVRDTGGGSAADTPGGGDEIAGLEHGIDEMIRRRMQAEADLKRVNRELEDRVDERTRDLRQTLDSLQAEVVQHKLAQQKLEELNTEMQRTSVLAGMAEVASGVLHNIGNVLNSVNVSASLIAGKLRSAHQGNLKKAVELLREHKDDLTRFLTEDKRGKELLPYLEKLHGYLDQERQAIAQETDVLRQHIEHMRDIVRMQQDYARMSRFAEEVSLQELLEDAIRFTSEALDRKDIEVRREYEALPNITVERHKVLQILVNLIRNARDALVSEVETGRIMTFRLQNCAGDKVRVVVADNGKGIPEEILTRIFRHGFTTRPDGHGFGLHSASLTAKQLGGVLIVHSDGIG